MRNPAPDPFFAAPGSRRLLFGAILVSLAVYGLVDVPNRASWEATYGRGWDFSCYVAAARALSEGADPYAAANVRGWHYVYPPPLAVLLLPLHGLPLAVQGLLWYAVNVACGFGAYFAAVGIHRAITPGHGHGHGHAPLRLPGWLGLLPFLVAVAPGIHTLQHGQVTLVLLFLQLAGLRLVLEGPARARFLGGVVLAAAVALKVVPLVPAAVLLAGLVSARRSRSPMEAAFLPTGAGLALGLVLFLAVAPSLVLGPRVNARHLAAFSEKVLFSADMGRTAGVDPTAMGNQSLLNSLRHARDAAVSGRLHEALGGLPSSPASPAGRLAWAGLVLLLGGAALAVAVQSGHRGDRAGLAAAFGLAVAAGLLASPISWIHQFAQLVPGAAFTARALEERGRGFSAAAAAAVPAFLVIAVYAVRPAQAFGLLGIGLAAWVVVVSALLLASAPARAEESGGV